MIQGGTSKRLFKMMIQGDDSRSWFKMNVALYLKGWEHDSMKAVVIQQTNGPRHPKLHTASVCLEASTSRLHRWKHVRAKMVQQSAEKLFLERIMQPTTTFFSQNRITLKNILIVSSCNLYLYIYISIYIYIYSNI